MIMIQRLSALWILLAPMGCQGAAPDASTQAPIAELIATQSAAYGVPPTASGPSFMVAASMGAVRWARLDAPQLRAWWQLWRRVRDDSARPVEEYRSESGALANLFDRSARDGFCVAFSQRSAGTLRPDLAAFFDDL